MNSHPFTLTHCKLYWIYHGIVKAVFTNWIVFLGGDRIAVKGPRFSGLRLRRNWQQSGRSDICAQHNQQKARHTWGYVSWHVEEQFKFQSVKGLLWGRHCAQWWSYWHCRQRTVVTTLPSPQLYRHLWRSLTMADINSSFKNIKIPVAKHW